jgi:hypothetical protein
MPMPPARGSSAGATLFFIFLMPEMRVAPLPLAGNPVSQDLAHYFYSATGAPRLNRIFVKSNVKLRKPATKSCPKFPYNSSRSVPTAS